MTRRLVVVAAIALGVPAVAVGVPGGGAVVQLPGKAGCHTGPGSAGCTPAVGVVSAETIAVSRDGRNVYAGGGFGSLGRLAVFARNPATGRLTQLGGRDGCFQVYRASRRCAAGRALETPRTIVVSPDGANVYVTAQSNSAIAVFARGAGGRLRQLTGQDACVSQIAARCALVRSLGEPSGLAVSPDGVHVYAGSNSSVAVFRRLQPHGRLQQLVGQAGCVNLRGASSCARAAGAFHGGIALAVSPDGRKVYAVSGIGVLHVFDRDRASGRLTQTACLSHEGLDPACPGARALRGGAGLAVSPDGRNVYVAARFSSGVASFVVDPASGSLTQLSGVAGCATATGSQGRCSRGTALVGARSVAVSGDGRWVYVAADGEFSGRRGGVAVFSRNATSGALTQAGCIATAALAGCTRGRALAKPGAVVATADGRNAYSASFGRGGGAAHSAGGGVAVFRTG